MGLLRLAVLGPPEVFHDESRLTFSLRKAQALLLYLAVEGGLHPRSKLAAFLWPDSEPHDARTALRNAIALLRSLLADPHTASVPHTHLLSQQELLGLDPQAPLELDLEVVQQAYTQAQRLSTPPAEPQRASLVAQVQQALTLVRGPFLDGFWLREETAFDGWHEQQQQQWHMRLQLLCDRLSSWQEAAGELEQARATLLRWLALDGLTEEVYRRLMRVHLALGDASAALQVYATCRARLAEALQVKPSVETVALAEHIRGLVAARRGSAPALPVRPANEPPGELVVPLVGRVGAFSHLAARYQQARQGQPQAVLVAGEAGIGKTRLVNEFASWARAQGAEVLSGHAFEAGGRLPYQPLVEALRTRLEEENAPEDLLEDPWLAELARLLPELRVRYPDLLAPTQDEQAAKVRLFEAVARLVDALARRAPLLLLLDDLHWVDGSSLDLVRYLARYWKEHSSRVLLLGTLRSEELEPRSQLAAELSDLRRDLPVSQVPLHPLSQAETLQLVQAIVREAGQDSKNEGEQEEPITERPSGAAAPPGQERATPLVALGGFLFAQTGGQPFYLLETLKLLCERQWLVPQLAPDGTWRLEPTEEMATVVAQEQSWRELLLTPSVRSMILARLVPLSSAARQLVMANAVLGNRASAQRLWKVAEMDVQAGIEALEEAVSSGILREEEARAGRPASYYFAHELIREVVYTELGEARRQVLHQRVLALLQSEGARASELAYHALGAGEAEAAYRYNVQAEDEAMAVFAIEDAIMHYEQARALFHEHVQQTVQELFHEGSLLSITDQELAERATVDPVSFPQPDNLYVCLWRAYALQHAWGKAQEAYEELVAYAQQHRLPTLVSMALNRVAILAVQQSFDKPRARALLEQAWQIAITSHDQRVLAETEWNLAQIMAAVWGDPKRALPHGEHALSLARGIHDRELEARSLSLLGAVHLLGGDFEEAMHALEASLALYAALGNEPATARELSLPSFIIGSPPAQLLTHCAAEAFCWGLLALAQMHGGQVQHSLHSGRKALALSKESKNDWLQVMNTLYLAYALQDTGAYEEALVLMQQTLELARTLPAIALQGFLTALGSIYHALQQWEEAQAALEEAEAVAETLGLGPFRMPGLSQLCMHHALAGQWEQAQRYALQVIIIRKSHDAALITLDFYHQYETEALLHAGDERQAREEVQRLGERLGPNRRFRLPYLRSLATLAACNGQSEQAISHLREAAQIAGELGLPAECWQIQSALGREYEAAGKHMQARTAFGEAAAIIQGLAEGIKNEALRSRFLAGPQIRPVLQHAQSLANELLKNRV